MNDELFDDFIESIKSLPTHVLEEMERNMKEHNIPNQYYKHLESGIEMLFIFDTRFGWSVSFMQSDAPFMMEVPFPEVPEKYKAQVDQFHVELEKKYQNWRDG